MMNCRKVFTALLVFSLACSDHVTDIEPGEARAEFVSATREWETGGTNLRVEVQNTGTVSGIYSLDIWSRNEAGDKWLARQTPAKSLPLGSVPVRLWRVDQHNRVPVILVELYTLSNGVWTLTDSLLENEIGTDVQDN